jgi:asparagine synthetase B (glutamine-hydrolysing)
MPNLVGVWKHGSQPLEPAEALERQLADAQSGFRPFTIHRMQGERWAAALVDHGLLENGAQPGGSADARVQVLLDGEIYNLRELAARAGVAPGLPAATACALLIAARGLDVVRDFNGLFALVVAEDAGRRLSLVSDRYGFRPLFYRASERGVSFGSEMKAVIGGDGLPPSFDATAVCELLVYGVHFAGRTWLAGCRRLAPATILTIASEGLHERRYWTYRYRREGARSDVEALATSFAVLLDRAVERCMRGTKRIGLFLSGGYDSRSVAAAVRAEHLPLPAFTFGEPGSRDVRIAPLLAARLGLRHYYLQGTKPYLAPHAAAIVWRTEGLLPFSNTTSVRFHDDIAAHADIILTGFLAEFSGSHTWPALLLARSRRGAQAAIRERFVTSRLERARRVLRPEAYAAAAEELRDRFEASFEAVADEHPFDVADSWNFMHLQPNGTFQAPAVDRHRFEVRAPHMDTELVDFLLSIPPWTRIEQRVYKLMIARAYPGIRDVPCANSLRPIEPRVLVEYPRMTASWVGRRLAGPVRRLVGREDRLGREISDLDADYRAEPALRTRLFEPLLRDGSLDERLFDLDRLQRMVVDEYEGRGDHAALLGQVMSLGLAQRMLARSGLEDVPPAYRRAS